MKSQLDPILEPLMAAVRRAERFLGPDDDWVEDDRRILFETAQRLVGGVYPYFTVKKGPRDYITTAKSDPERIEEVLHDAGYERNLASSRKYREHHSGGKQWAVGSWVLDPADTPTQHHVYLFPAPDGGTDIYGHFETSVREGIEHLTETNQKHGDPHGTVRDALRSADVAHYKRKALIPSSQERTVQNHSEPKDSTQ